jgi:hypothetical protein
MSNNTLTQILHFISSLAVLGLLAALAAIGTITSAVALPAIGLIVGQLLGIQGFTLGTGATAPVIAAAPAAVVAPPTPVPISHVSAPVPAVPGA